MHKMTMLWIVLITLIGLTPAGAQGGHSDRPQRTSIAGAESRVYKTAGETELLLHVFQPDRTGNDAPRPAIVFFFGGGWIGGNVRQFVPQCEYLAGRGMVAVVADYRVRSRHGVSAFECVADAKSAIRWLRIHATKLGIDENRIAAGGGSSGGHLAACTALIRVLDEGDEDPDVSSAPNALVLFNPGLDLPEVFAMRGEEEAVARFGQWVVRSEEISPMQHVGSDAPPTIIFHGTADTVTPFEHTQRFGEEMRAQGNRCEVVPFAGRRHGFFNLGRGGGSEFWETLRKTDEFLASLGYLRGKPEVDTFRDTKAVLDVINDVRDSLKSRDGEALTGLLATEAEAYLPDGRTILRGDELTRLARGADEPEDLTRRVVRIAFLGEDVALVQLRVAVDRLGGTIRRASARHRTQERRLAARRRVSGNGRRDSCSSRDAREEARAIVQRGGCGAVWPVLWSDRRTHADGRARRPQRRGRDSAGDEADLRRTLQERAANGGGGAGVGPRSADRPGPVVEHPLDVGRICAALRDHPRTGLWASLPARDAWRGWRMATAPCPQHAERTA
jgi:acetyl esterase/lipase